jgi:hypothetical protein
MSNNLPYFNSSILFRPTLESTKPPAQLVKGVFSMVVKRAGSEADHSRPSSVQVKKTWIYTSTLPHAFMK